MKYKILKFLGFERRDFCGKYIWKYFMKSIRTTDCHKDRVGYIVHICKDCQMNVKED